MEAHVPLAVVLGVVAAGVVAVLGYSWRRQRRRARRPVPAYRGLGGALALALDGDFAAAARLVEAEVRGGSSSPEHLLAWVALLRARGHLAEAAQLVERVRRRRDTPWLAAMHVRLALDQGQVEVAADGALEPGVPIDLALAALMRAGRWADAKGEYDRRVDKRARSAGVLALLEAGTAVDAARRGALRPARKAIKRALALEPQSLAVQAVAARLHPKDDTRARLSEALDAQQGGAPEIDGLDVGAVAKAAYEAGEVQHALGLLRDRLDVAPDDTAARLQYGRWLLAHGEPADWRAELADLLDQLAPATSRSWWRCTRCHVVVEALVFVCPRCDTIERPEPVAASRIQSGVEVVTDGARVADLTKDLPDPGPVAAR